MTIIKPKIALARLTSDSIASDSKPTESVMYQASVFKVMVTMATTTEAHSMPRGDSERARAKGLTRSTQSDPGELALAHLHHVGADIELETFVADDR